VKNKFHEGICAGGMSKKMIKVGINGFGRIGRAIMRVNMENPRFDVPIINDINPDIESVAYTINYDTTYGSLTDWFVVEGQTLKNSQFTAHVSTSPSIDEIDWDSYGVSIVIDASGTKENLLKARRVIEKNPSVKKVIVTHSPNEVDFTMVLGVNEDKYDSSIHHVISSSICDATAIAPVLKIILDNYGIESASITTVHPLLGYQNVLDGLCASWSMPGQTHVHYPLGRSIIDNLIPKPTTAVNATCKLFDAELLSKEKIASFSYRTPTTIVASSDITLILDKKTTTQQIMNLFEEYENTQNWPIIHHCGRPLVSLDYKKNKHSAVVDHRWTQVTNDRLVKLILWYDNEWGYSSRVCDQIMYIEQNMR